MSNHVPATGQLQLIEQSLNLDNLPPTKMARTDLSGVHGWTTFYAAFPESFAVAGLRALGAVPGSVVLDPFLGSGTTAVAALRLGISAIGGDLDPFACLLSRSKIAIRAESRSVRALLSSLPKDVRRTTSFTPSAQSVFSDDCLAYAESVFARLFKHIGGPAPDVLTRLLSDREGDLDSEVVALAALCIAAADAAKLVRGSNPTWYRTAMKGERLQVDTLKAAVQTRAQTMLSDLHTLAATTLHRDVQIYNTDARVITPEGENVDYVLTSPPYLTRIDYVVKHLPHLLLLSGFVDLDLGGLRQRMIGTSKIGEIGADRKEWGPTCLGAVGEVRDHPSYASRRYYARVYQQYFDSVYSALKRSTALVKESGSGLIVVQDSLYKDVFIDLSTIVAEMLQGLGFRTRLARRAPIKSALRTLNPRVKKKGTTTLFEGAVHFQR